MIVDMHQQANPFFSSKNLPSTTKHGRLTFSPLILLIIGVTFSIIIIIIISSYNAFSIVVLLFSLIGISLLVLTNSKRLSFIVVILYLLVITLL